MDTLRSIRADLAKLAKLDRRHRVFGSNTHKYQLNPPLTAAEVEGIEAASGCRLPDQYRKYVLEIADGGAGPDHGIIALRTELDYLRRDPRGLKLLAESFPPQTALLEWEEEDDPPGGIAVSEGGCGAYSWLVARTVL